MRDRPFTAVLFALIIVLSMVTAPIGAAPAAQPDTQESQEDRPDHPSRPSDGTGPPPKSTGPSGPDPDDIIPPTIEYDANSTVGLHDLARETIADVDTNGSASQLQSATIRSINSSAGAYYGGMFVESEAPFEDKIQAQKDLRNLGTKHDVNTSAVNTTSEMVLDAGNMTARFMTRIAAQQLHANDDAFDSPGELRSTRQALQNAVDALERGDEALTDDQPRGGPPGNDLESRIKTRENALTHYRTAVRHAIRVLERIENETEPRLRVSENALYRDNGTVVADIRITLVDTRSYLYENASVTVTSTDTCGCETTTLRTRWDNTSVAIGRSTVSLGSESGTETITVETASASASAAHPNRTVSETITVSVEDADLPPNGSGPGIVRNVTITDPESGVSVEARGAGILEQDVHIGNVTVPADVDDPYRVGPVVRLQNRTDFETATVTMPVDEDIAPGANVSIFTLDPSTQRGWEPVDTRIDAENDTVTATVGHFSFFSVFHVDDWEDYRTVTITLEEEHFAGRPAETGPIQNVDLVLVSDESGSMGGSRIENSRIASKRFVSALLEGDRVGVVGYSGHARLLHGLTSNFDAVNDSIDRLSAGGSTNTGDGLNTALDEFEANASSDHRKVIILLSDGKTNTGPNPIQVAKEAAQRDIQISTVGLGNGINEGELRRIANITGGDFYHVTSAEDLPDVFERIAENQSAVALKDSNGDGIPDAVADANPPMPGLGLVDRIQREAGIDSDDRRISIDPVLTDTDTDGLADNETIAVEYRVFDDAETNETKLSTRVVTARAHPAQYDTDSDGLSDYEELEVWDTNPRVADTSGDGLIDSVDPAPNEETYPPEFEYRTWDLADLGVNIGGITLHPAVIDLTENLAVVGRPRGGADEIEAIKVHQYVETWIPWIDDGWRNRTYSGSSLNELADGEVVYVNPPFGDTSGSVAPDIVRITVTDDDGNRAGVTHDVEATDVDLSAGIAPTATAAAALPVGATAPQTVGGTTAVTVTGASVGTAALAAAGVIVAVGGFAVLVEAKGSAAGEYEARDRIQPVPVTEVVRTWDDGTVEIVLPSGALYGEEVPDHERGHGWEQIRRLPGITDVTDIDETFTLPGGIQDQGTFDYVIGENGEHVLWIYEGYVVAGETTLEEEEVEEEVTEEANEGVEEDDRISEEDVDETIRDGPDDVTTGPRYKYYIYRIVDEGVRFVLRTVGEQIVDYAVDRSRDDEPECALESADVDMTVTSTTRDQFQAAESEYKEFRGTFERTQKPVDVEFRCVLDREEVVQTYADDPTDITDGTIGENITVELINQRGYDLKFPVGGFDEGDISEIGPDAIAYDASTDEWLIVEAKTTTSTEAVGIGLLQTNAYEGDPQLSDEWILNSLEELNRTDNINSELAHTVRRALEEGRVKKEIVFVRDVTGASGRTLKDPQSIDTDISVEIGVDKVTIIDLRATEG